MTTIQPEPRPRLGPLNGLGVALGALVAIAVSVLFLALTSAGYTVHVTSTIHTHRPSTHTAPIQHWGAVRCHPVLDPRTGQMHGGCPPQ